MNKLHILNSMGFKISWKLISIGLYGNDNIQALLTYDEVLEYLDNLLEDINEQTDNIIALICERDDVIRFDKLLKELAKEDNSNTDIQNRKWRACLLKVLIDDIYNDCLQGLLELMEFWVSMGMPDDCPQVFPNSNNKKSVKAYFTQTSYEFNVNKNREWLNEEILNIVKLEESDNGSNVLNKN